MLLGTNQNAGPMPGAPAAQTASRAAAALSAVAAVPPHRPAGYQPKVWTEATDHQGNPVGVACGTCHSTREPNRHYGSAGHLPQAFHQGLKYAHADLSCLACHHAEDYDSLRLADGRRLPFSAAQQLCAQCHGPQTRDYLNGSHGGMNGSWDREAQKRSRNTCTDCHDPHHPAYPTWTPIFAPRDSGARQQAVREPSAAPTGSTPHGSTLP